jgi:hypothetical protein
MKKFVITTVQMVKRSYYVEVEDPTWAHDGIVMGELSEFTQEHMSEDIVVTQEVTEFSSQPRDIVNGAVMKFDYEANRWGQEVRWDLSTDPVPFGVTK